MCDFSAKCKNEAEFNVIHKAVGAMLERTVAACHTCAAKIGKLAPGGPVLNTESRENAYYRVEAL